jgi:NIMA (never in mitosis gene a)-related kinase
MIELLQALKYIHDSKLLHRDIKTENIFLDKKMKIKLGDFGTAKLKQYERTNSSEGRSFGLD